MRSSLKNVAIAGPVILTFWLMAYIYGGFRDGEPLEELFDVISLPPEAIATEPFTYEDGSSSYRLERYRQSFTIEDLSDLKEYYSSVCRELEWDDRDGSPGELYCGKNAGGRWRGLSVRPCDQEHACTHELTVWATRSPRW